MGRFDGKVVFVSGAARGQGRAHALGFAQEGANVIAVDACTDHAGLGYAMSGAEDLQETVRLVEETGQQIVAGQADVRSQSELDAVVADGLSKFGRVDVILANAGVLTMAENSWEMTEDEWNTVVDINLSGAWRTCKAGIPAMVEGDRGGAIILTATSNGYRAEQGHASYNAAKLGMVGLMHTLAGELGRHRIRVNTVHPSIVRTDLIYNDVIVPLMFPGQTTSTMDEDDFYRQIDFLHEVPGVMQPSDVTEVMKFLASEAGRFTTGAEVLIDGGYVHKVFDYKAS